MDETQANDANPDAATGPTATGGSPLDGRHAVITGGGRGIGASVAARLAAMGARITLMGRDAAVLEAKRAELESASGLATAASGGVSGPAVAAVTADVADEASVTRAFAAAAAAHGAPSILVNNAGAAQSASFKRTDTALWRAMLDVNLTGTYLCTRQVLPAMIEAGWGRIINIASTAGLTGYAYVTAYCAAKHGVVGLTRALALETAKRGVTVNAVCPGYTDTDMTARTVENIVAKTGCTADEARAQIAVHNPQGRLIDPEEVASAAAWLALPASHSITGQTIAVAGGEVM